MRASRQLLRMLVGRRYVEVAAGAANIGTALTAISDNKAIRPYTLNLGAGTFTLTATVSNKPHCSLKGAGAANTIVTRATASQTLMYGANGCHFSDATFSETGAASTLLTLTAGTGNALAGDVVTFERCTLSAKTRVVNQTCAQSRVEIDQCAITTGGDGIYMMTAAGQCARMMNTTVVLNSSLFVVNGVVYVGTTDGSAQCDNVTVTGTITKASSHSIFTVRGTMCLVNPSVTVDCSGVGVQIISGAHAVYNDSVVKVYGGTFALTHTGGGTPYDLDNNGGGYFSIYNSPTYATSRGVLAPDGVMPAYGRVQTLIDAATSGDTITLPAGTYTGEIECKAGVNITGAGIGVTIIRHGGNPWNDQGVIFPANGCTITGCTLDGTGVYGTCITDLGHAVATAMVFTLDTCQLDSTYDCIWFGYSSAITLTVHDCILNAHYDGIVYRGSIAPANSTFALDMDGCTVTRSSDINAMTGLIRIEGQSTILTTMTVDDSTFTLEGTGGQQDHDIIHVTTATAIMAGCTVTGAGTLDTPKGVHGVYCDGSGDMKLYDCDVAVTNVGTATVVWDLRQAGTAYFGVDAPTTYVTSTGTIIDPM